MAEPGPEGADGKGRVEQDQLGADVVGQGVDAPAEAGPGQEELLGRPVDPVGLLGVPLGGTGPRGGEDGDVLGREPAPQLPEVRLDPAELGREVVGDEQVAGHGARRWAAQAAWRRSIWLGWVR
jgi:hypothetical protein